MSLAHTLSLHPGSLPPEGPARLANGLLLALATAALALPVAMIWMKLVVTRPPPIEVLPPSPAGAADETDRGIAAAVAVPPIMVLPRESVAPPEPAGMERLAPVEAPSADGLPARAPGAIALPPVGLPDAAASPSIAAGGARPLTLPGNRARAGSSAHAQVVALLEMMARQKSSTTHRTAVAKPQAAGKAATSKPPRPQPVAAALAMVPSIPHRGVVAGVLGGPATAAGAPVLDGTTLRHKP